MRANIARDWKISTAYYTIYFSLYAILMRLGVKCEIHSCTIEFAKRFLKDYFEESEVGFIKDSLKARIDSQYYVDRIVPGKVYNEMVRKAPEFMIKCKYVLARLNEKRVNEIRDRFRKEASKG